MTSPSAKHTTGTDSASEISTFFILCTALTEMKVFVAASI